MLNLLLDGVVSPTRFYDPLVTSIILLIIGLLSLSAIIIVFIVLGIKRKKKTKSENQHKEKIE